MTEIIHYSVKINEPEPDMRYRTLVVLSRSDRPSNFSYHCHRCTRPVVEILNAAVVSTTDLINMEDTARMAVGRRCYGSYWDDNLGKKVNCHQWYYFMVN